MEEFLSIPIIACLIALTVSIIVGGMGYGWWTVPIPLIALASFWWMQGTDRNEEPDAAPRRKRRRRSDW